MTEVQDIPVSVTYTGKTMQRHEVVAYLKELCFYKVAQDELKEAVNGMSSRIQELETKYNKQPMPPPSKKPPERNWVISCSHILPQDVFLPIRGIGFM